MFRRFFRTDDIASSACSHQLPEGSRCTDEEPVLRHFDTLSEAAWENAESRVYIGIHFREAVEAGYQHGTRIGSTAVNRHLTPVRGHRWGP